MDPALLLVAGLAVILLLQFSRVRRQQREVRATQSAVAVGAEVLTASGMVGTVVEATGATVVLAGEDGQRTRWVTAAVVRVLGPDDPASASYVPPAPATPGSTDAATDAGTDAGADPTTGTGRPDAVDGDGHPRTQD